MNEGGRQLDPPRVFVQAFWWDTDILAWARRTGRIKDAKP